MPLPDRNGRWIGHGCEPGLADYVFSRYVELMQPSVSSLLTLAAAAMVALPAVVRAQETDSRQLRVYQTTEVRLNDTLSPDLPSNGEVRVAVLVDNHGGLKDLLLLGSTHFNFTQAVVAALQEWKFEPARNSGQAVWTRSTLRIFIDARGRIVNVAGADALSALVNRPFAHEFTSRLVGQAELDLPLQASATVRPRFPIQLSGKLGERAAVVLDFYVDEDGRPRMPVAVRSTHPYLTEAAMDALDQWRFSPPTRDRKPVVVRARQEFVFHEREVEESGAPVALAQ
jgi:TonB family protein